ncbi:hypothetical protein BP5796_09877 [Coleophoma crateriformis]|uniref:Zn(2)-C6 fungal-type domain-containing protein n=1 Tax=Coleophoma crateriformis TaxID=565419 RepID=A0A3D8QTS4_9HELO|nr:hypothetical protein BP5796_09877 [Coleophoma crateriformis]
METPIARRSHFGCTRCKRRRQKCDEKRPSCGRCDDAKTECTYTLTLRWGGRASRRSKVIAETASSTPKPIVKEPLREAESLAIVASKNTTPTQSSITAQIEPLYFLSSSTRFSLHYFIHRASHATSSHPRIQERICGMIVPMALETPSLLYATIALSELHRSSLLDDFPENFDQPAGIISRSLALSLQTLQSDLTQGRKSNRYATLTTIRTLCIFEIHSGKAAPDSWRAHMEGAKALLTATRNMYGTQAIDESDPQWLIERWFASIESFTALTERGLLKGQLETFGSQSRVRSPTTDDQYLDVYSAYTGALNAAFKEIGAAAWERRRLNTSDEESKLLTQHDLDLEATSLESSVRSMIGRSKFHPGVQTFLTAAEMEQFKASDEAYQYTALIHVQRRVHLLPKSSLEVQDTVKKIIQCVKKISPVPGLSPWVMATTPLFAAGREALGNDRNIDSQCKEVPGHIRTELENGLGFRRNGFR